MEPGSAAVATFRRTFPAAVLGLAVLVGSLASWASNGSRPRRRVRSRPLTTARLGPGAGPTGLLRALRAAASG
jgi:hypothetical protein